MAITHLSDSGGISSPANTAIIMSTAGFTAGSTVAAILVLQDTTRTVTGSTDDTTAGPMVFSFITALNVTGARIELWSTAVGGGKAGGSFLRFNFSGSTLAAGCWTQKAGVVAFGLSGTNSGTAADPTIALTTQDADNFVIGGFAAVGATVPTAKTGTLRETRNSGDVSPVGATCTDNTSAGAGSVTNAITLAATTWAAVALELRSTAGGAGGAAPRAMHAYRSRRST